MRAGEYRSMTPVELDNRVDELKRTLFERRQELLTGELENTNLIKITKRDLARALTEQRRRQLAEDGAKASRRVKG